MTRITFVLAMGLLPLSMGLAAEPEQGSAAENQSPTAEKWTSLNPEGNKLVPWEITPYGGEGEIRVEEGLIHLADGATLTGIRLTQNFPKTNYELRYEAQRVMGVDFFGGVTFPYGETYCNFIPAGWGGAVVGLSTIDGRDASENETTKYMTFKDGQWYRFKLRVTPEKIMAWVDDELAIDLKTAGKKIAPRADIDPAAPLGFYTWQSSAKLRNIAYREIPAE